MYNIGDMVIYSAHGICKIDDICEKTVSGINRLYYVLNILFKELAISLNNTFEEINETVMRLIQGRK